MSVPLLSTTPIFARDSRVIAYNSSTVNFSGGSTSAVGGFGNGVVNISGGNIDHAFATDLVKLTVTGVTLNTVFGSGNSTVDLTGVSVRDTVSGVRTSDSSIVNISASDTSKISSGGDSIVNFSSGTISDAISAGGNSTINFSGGVVRNVSSSFFSSLNISGGTITGDISLFFGASTLSLTGNSFNVSAGKVYGHYDPIGPYEANYAVRDYTITGNLSDGTAFSKTLTAAANTSVLRTDFVQLRGEEFDKADNRLVESNESVSGVYDLIEIGGKSVDAPPAEPIVTLEAGLDVGNINVYSGSQVTMNEGLIHGYLEAFNSSTVDIFGGVASKGGVAGYGNSTINISGGTLNTYANDNSTVNISGGNLRTAGASDNGIINVTGGVISESLNANDSAALNISGGNVKAMRGGHYATLNISGGNVDSASSDDLSEANLSGGVVQYGLATEFSTFNVSGGLISVNVSVRDASTLNITGGYVNAAGGNETSILNVSGGSVGELAVSRNGTINITGGIIDEKVQAFDSAKINIAGGSVNNTHTYDSAVLTVSGGTITGEIGVHEISTLNLRGSNLGVIVGDTHGFYNVNSRTNYTVRDYSITGNLNDGTYINKTVTAAANTSNLGDSSIRLRGKELEKAPDIYIIQSGLVDGVYNKVTVGRDASNAASNPVVTLGDGFDSVDMFLYNNNRTTLIGGNVRGLLNANDSTDLSISGSNIAHLRSFDNSVISGNGGEFDRVSTAGSSTVAITGGIISGFVSSSDSSNLDIVSSNFTSESSSLYGSGSSTIRIADTDLAFASIGNTATLNIAGGNTDQVATSDYSVVTLVRGSITEIYGSGSSTVNVLGGNVDGVYFGYDYYDPTEENGTFNMTGGSVGYAYVGFGTANIAGGNLVTVQGGEDSVLNITGGNISDILGSGNSIFNLSGGTIGSDTIRLFDDSVLNVFANQLFVSYTGVGSDYRGSYTSYLLSGMLAGGQSLSGVKFIDYDGGLSLGDPSAGQGNTGNLRFLQTSVTVVPEPGTLALLGLPLIGLAGYRKRRA